MNQICKAGYAEISVAEAKRLIVDAGPKEFGNQLHATEDDNGSIQLFNETHDEVKTYEFTIDAEFVDLCRSLGIVPCSRYGRGLDAYVRFAQGAQAEAKHAGKMAADVMKKLDESFHISHGEFGRLAAAYDLEVVAPLKAGNPGQPKKMELRIEAIQEWIKKNVANGKSFSKSPGRGGGDQGRCCDAMLTKPSLFPNRKAFTNTWQTMGDRKMIDYGD